MTRGLLALFGVFNAGWPGSRWAAALGLTVATCGLAAGCRGSEAPSPPQPQMQPTPAPQCDVSDDCPMPSSQCTAMYCREGRCVEDEAPPKSRCGLSAKYALTQGNRAWHARNDLGICVHNECIPRLLCMRRCGERLGNTLAEGPPSQLGRCAGQPKCDVDPLLVDEAVAGILDCAIGCGFPTPEIDVRD